MSDLFTTQQARQFDAVSAVSRLIAIGDLDRKVLNEACNAAFNGSNANGAWSQRDSFEIMEQGLVHHARTLEPITSIEQIAILDQLSRALPTQTVRSEDQIRFQQFSTPLELAGLMILLAQPKPSDIVLEPSAGNGALVAMLPKVKEIHLNELDGKRKAILEMQFTSASVTSFDGAMLSAHLPKAFLPTLILMNPPFARSEGRGKDRYAAVRHLRSAISRLAPNGRIVAIMPEWFVAEGPMRKIYEATFDGCTVAQSYFLQKSYIKQGTSIAIRLLVIDKRPGPNQPMVIQGDSVTKIASKIAIPARRTLPAAQPATQQPGQTSISLFKATRSGKTSAVPLSKPRVSNAAIELSYTSLKTPRPLGKQSGVYLPYRPSRIDICSAAEHPTALVESVAMGSIPAPVPDYRPKILERVLKDKLVSEAQLETLIYAGTAWSQFLPGRYKPDEEGVALSPKEDGDQYRKGYFLGDGTGAGKGRQIAICILDSWLSGRRRNIWVSKNESLLEDARRDWQAIGGLAADIQPLSGWKIDEPITMGDGILFITFPTLRSQRQDATRLRQVLNWAGSDYEGIMAFDESHEMGGVAGGEGALGKTKGSQQGIAGVRLQNHLPLARVLYASATGASDVNNLAYAVRLGLWGEGTSFANRENFISEIRAGGIAAMELVSRDLKALGLYQARALSFAGVEYEVLKHPLGESQIQIYDAYADAWSIIHRHMERALALTGVVDDIDGGTLNSGAKAAARSRLESCKQRFFSQLLLSMKMPTVIAATDEHLANGQAVVIQLVTTAESILDRRLGNMSAQERANLDIDLSPREYVVDYLDRAFPTQQMRPYTDETGEQRSEPMFDDAGNPVHNEEALQAKANLIEQLCSLPTIASALDAVINHYGTEAVAEVTGRTKRLVSLPNGQQRLEARSARTNQAEASSFMNDEKRILIFSDAGGTGRSYHASLDAQNQRQRVHLLLEPGWRADRAIQGLGRTHRTHQATTPLFRPCTTDCKGELRFTSTIARRLDSLGALTRGQRQTGGQNLFDPSDNLESEYAKSALITWFGLLHAGKLKSTTLCEFEHRSGLSLTDKDGVLNEDLPPIQRWLNRILALPINVQNTIFDEFLGLVEARVNAAREAGTLDVGVETIMVDRAKVVEDVVLRTDQRTGAQSHLLSIEVEKRFRPTSVERIVSLADNSPRSKFMLNEKSGKAALVEKARSLMEDDGELLPRVRLIRPIRTDYMLVKDLEESAWKEIPRTKFTELWNTEVEEALTRTTTEMIYLATGLLLPIWSSLPRDYLNVNRIVDEQGQSWLGRTIDEHDVPGILQKFGLASNVQIRPDQILGSLKSRGSVSVERPWPMTFRQSLVNGEQRVELLGEFHTRLAQLKAIGCFTEIIQYKTRLFIPTSTAHEIITRILED